VSPAFQLGTAALSVGGTDSTAPLIEEFRSITTNLLTDAAIVAAPTAAVVVKHLLDKPKDAPPPPETPKKD
jgi:hypothetical protein